MIIYLLYILFFLLVILGYGTLLSQLLKEKAQHIIILFLYGFFLISLLTSAAVVFFPLSWYLKIALWLGGLILPFLGYPKNTFADLKGPSWLKITYIGFGLIFILTKISSPAEIMDEGYQYLNLYHMFEQVGVSIGIGDLIPHITLNSNWHLLNSIFNPQGIFINYSIYELNGLLCVLIFLLSYHGAVDILNNNLEVSAVIKLLSPLFLLRNQLTGGGTDVVVYIIGIILLTHLLDITHAKERIQTKQLYPLVIIPTLLITIKFLTLPFTILALGATMFLAKKEKLTLFLPALILCSCFLGLWLLRNALLSGYLLSGTAFAPLEVSWRMSLQAISTVSSRTQFGIFGHPNFTSLLFLKEWILAYPFSQRVLVLLSFLATLAYVVILSIKFFNKSIRFFEFLFFAILILGFVTWTFTISEFRYGALYHFFNALLAGSIIAARLSEHVTLVKYLPLGVFACGIVFQISRNLREFPFLSRHIVQPAKNPTVKFEVVKRGTKSYYIPISYKEPLTDREVFYFNMTKELYDQPGCWNTPFPCVGDSTMIK